MFNLKEKQRTKPQHTFNNFDDFTCRPYCGIVGDVQFHVRPLTYVFDTCAPFCWSGRILPYCNNFNLRQRRTGAFLDWSWFCQYGIQALYSLWPHIRIFKSNKDAGIFSLIQAVASAVVGFGRVGDIHVLTSEGYTTATSVHFRFTNLVLDMMYVSDHFRRCTSMSNVCNGKAVALGTFSTRLGDWIGRCHQVTPLLTITTLFNFNPSKSSRAW